MRSSSNSLMIDRPMFDAWPTRSLRQHDELEERRADDHQHQDDDRDGGVASHALLPVSGPAGRTVARPGGRPAVRPSSMLTSTPVVGSSSVSGRSVTPSPAPIPSSSA